MATTAVVRARDLVGYLTRGENVRRARLVAAAQGIEEPGFIFTFNTITKSVREVYNMADHLGARAVVGPSAGYVIPAGNRLRSVSEGRPLHDHIRWRDEWNREELYFADAAAVGVHGIAILCAVNVWDSLHAASDDGLRTAPVHAKRARACCGVDAFLSWCTSAKARHVCSNCGACPCTVADGRSVQCDKCFELRPAHNMVDGVCLECRE